ncbi:tail fiber domain-containing protein [bacterium]|jgi:hypothetical protein|nr:tail fiber domain-containing protein [bacterium]
MKYHVDSGNNIDSGYIRSLDLTSSATDPTFYPLKIEASYVTFHNQAKIGIGVSAISEVTAELYVVGDIIASGSITPGSDRRWKKDITPINNSLEMVKQLQGRYVEGIFSFPVSFA